MVFRDAVRLRSTALRGDLRLQPSEQSVVRGLRSIRPELRVDADHIREIRAVPIENSSLQFSSAERPDA